MSFAEIEGKFSPGEQKVHLKGMEIEREIASERGKIFVFVFGVNEANVRIEVFAPRRFAICRWAMRERNYTQLLRSLSSFLGCELLVTLKCVIKFDILMTDYFHQEENTRRAKVLRGKFKIEKQLFGNRQVSNPDFCIFSLLVAPSQNWVAKIVGSVIQEARELP